jgi:hypothetical protein
MFTKASFPLSLRKTKSSALALLFLIRCGRGGIQTPNLLIRSQMLYSVKLRNLKFEPQIYVFFVICKSFLTYTNARNHRVRLAKPRITER